MSTYPNDFKVVIPFLVASVVYHKDFIVQHLPTSHPLFRSIFWRMGKQMELTVKVLPPTEMHCNVTKMVATGIAPVTTSTKLGTKCWPK